MDNNTEQLADGVWRIEVGPFLNAFLVAANGRDGGDGLTMVDCGTTRSGPRLVRSVRLLGMAPTAIRNVVLTHWHADHMGSAARLAASSAAPAVHVGRDDAPPVRGEVPRPHDLAGPGDITRLGRLVSRFATPGPPVDDVAILDDGQQLPFAHGARVVFSPGHTAGHVSVLVEQAGVLIAGDAVMNLGRLTQGFGPFRSARSHEPATLRRLADLQFDVLGMGHGPPIVSQARQRLQRLSEKVAG